MEKALAPAVLLSADFLSKPAQVMKCSHVINPLLRRKSQERMMDSLGAACLGI